MAIDPHDAKTDPGEPPRPQRAQPSLAQHPAPQHSAPPQPRKSRRRLWLYGLSALGVLIVLGAIAGASAYVVFSRGLPSIEWARRYRPPIVTEVFSGDEQLAGEFYSERRRVVPYERIPKKLVQAFVASEDKDFFDHPGVSFTGLGRALFRTYVLRSKRIEGGSTLTQQTAKAIIASAEGVQAARVRKGVAGVRRKIREFILTRQLENHFTKEQILNLYLNEVYLGHHAYGVQAAAENYFRKNVWELSLPEMALIAGLPQAPSAFSPFSNPEAARRRRSYVLGRMLAEGMISKDEHDRAEQAEISAYPVQDIFRETAPYVTEHVRRDVVQRYGNERLLNDGLKVYMTVDLERERDAIAATLKGILAVDKRQGYRGPLTHLTEKDWPGFIEKEQAWLTSEGKDEADADAEEGEEGSAASGKGVIAALVTAVDKDGKVAQINVGTTKGRLPLEQAYWARKPNPELNAKDLKIHTLKGVLEPGDVILVRRAPPKKDKKGKILAKAEKDLYALEQEPKIQGALISTDPNSGYVMAMIGGFDFEKSEFNRAFQACRQPGSSFKPIIYSAAIEQKGFTSSTILTDAPIVTDDEANAKRWKPNNFEESFRGDVPVRLALAHSMNIPAIKTLQAVGVKAAAEWAHKLGITTKINEDLSMALGSSCVTLWDLTNVYTLIDRMGQRPHMLFLRRVLDRDGRILEDHSSYYDPWTSLSDRISAGYARLFDKPEQVMQQETAFLVTHLMEGVVKFGTSTRALALGKPVAGKTGTTNDLFDAWFLGFTKDLVTGVWVGYDNYDQPMDKYETGGHTALPIWVDYMKTALKGVAQPQFLPPLGESIVWVSVDADNGRRAVPGSRAAVLEPFLKGTEPPEENALGVTPVQSGKAQETMLRDGL
jgi:penicillin-binding protein 1A